MLTRVHTMTLYFPVSNTWHPILPSSCPGEETGINSVPSSALHPLSPPIAMTTGLGMEHRIGKVRQEDCYDLEASPGYRASSSLGCRVRVFQVFCFYLGLSPGGAESESLTC